jgi:hypothetical protein
VEGRGVFAGGGGDGEKLVKEEKEEKEEEEEKDKKDKKEEKKIVCLFRIFTVASLNHIQMNNNSYLCVFRKCSRISEALTKKC